MKMKFKSIMILVLLFGVTIFLTCKKPEPETTGSINGTVTNKTSNEPIAGAIVTITPGNTSTGTGTDGKFNFKDLEPKEFTIQVVKDGYTTNTKAVTVIVGKDNTADIQLAPFKPEIKVLPTTLDFGTTEISKSVQVSNVGSGTTLSWTASTTDAWITLSPNNGTIQGTNSNPVSINVNRTNLNAGTYNGSIVFNASNSNTFTLQVTLTVPVPGAPSVTSGAAQNVTQTTASISAQLVSIGSNTVSQYGHCWSTNPAPTILDAKTSLGSASAPMNFSSTLTGLTANKIYYVRAYAINSVGTSYSSEINFTTTNVPTAPSVTTAQPTTITLTTAEIAGNIIDLGSSNVTEHGHCWSTSPAPTISNSKTTKGSASAPNSFSSGLTGLSGNTKYYVRAYATNSVGTSYSTEINFTTQTPTPATVTTGVASNVSFTSFSISANLTDLGNSAVTEHGHCWATSAAPTILNTKTTLGAMNATGTYSSNLTNLTANTTYYVRAYATNAGGTSYGAEVQVTTNAYSAPTVTSDAASNINFTTADLTGYITNIGYDNVIQYGHCWSTTPNPTTSNFKTQLGTASASKSFTSNLTGLSLNTKYYVRAYAINSIGTSYSSEVQFTTLLPSLPSVSTGTASASFNSGSVSGNLLTIGDLSVSQYGHCWSTSPNPTIANNKTQLGSATASTAFNSNLTGLQTGTTYYVKSYATNNQGTSYGNEISFSTQSLITPSGLLAFWNFDNSNVNDYTNNFNGLNVGNVTFSTDIPAGASGLSTSYASSNYYQIPTNPISGLTTYSLCFWIKTSSNGGIFQAGSSTYPLQVYVKDNYMIIQANNGNATNKFPIDISTIILDGNWHFVVINIKSSQNQLFVDGTLISQLLYNMIGSYPDNSGSKVGNSNYGGYLNGKLDNFRIYNRALIQSEITDIYNAKQ